MPALVNIKVGSLRGTSGEDGTISWPLSLKKFRKVDLISLTPLMFIQSKVARTGPQKRFPSSGGTLLEEVCGSVQKLCSEIMDLLQHTKAFESAGRRVDSLGIVVFSSYLSSAHFPKFVFYCGDTVHELRKVMGTSKLTILVPLSI